MQEQGERSYVKNELIPGTGESLVISAFLAPGTGERDFDKSFHPGFAG